MTAMQISAELCSWVLLISRVSEYVLMADNCLLDNSYAGDEQDTLLADIPEE